MDQAVAVMHSQLDAAKVVASPLRGSHLAPEVDRPAGSDHIGLLDHPPIAPMEISRPEAGSRYGLGLDPAIACGLDLDLDLDLIAGQNSISTEPNPGPGQTRLHRDEAQHQQYEPGCGQKSQFWPPGSNGRDRGHGRNHNGKGKPDR